MIQISVFTNAKGDVIAEGTSRRLLYGMEVIEGLGSKNLTKIFGKGKEPDPKALMAFINSDWSD